jgi:hypothetical protein
VSEAAVLKIGAPKTHRNSYLRKKRTRKEVWGYFEVVKLPLFPTQKNRQEMERAPCGAFRKASEKRLHRENPTRSGLPLAV